MKSFIEEFCTNYGINAPSAESLLKHMHEVNFKKGDMIFKPDAFNDNLYIVHTGIWRAFRPKDGEESTIWFAFHATVVINIWCYHYAIPSQIGIVAETDGKAFVLPRKKLEELCSHSLEIANTVRHIFEAHAASYEVSITSRLDCNDGHERYLSILDKHPELLQFVPLNKLASYLLVTPQSLSRIRANIKKQP